MRTPSQPRREQRPSPIPRRASYQWTTNATSSEDKSRPSPFPSPSSLAPQPLDDPLTVPSPSQSTAPPLPLNPRSVATLHRLRIIEEALASSKSSLKRVNPPEDAAAARPSTATATSSSSIVDLSDEQTRILQLVQTGANVFYTGSAGAGKSALLREIIQERRCQFPDPMAVAVTASTGIAACDVDGVTLHSFAGIGLGDLPLDLLIKRVRNSGSALERWTKVQVLIIDEISMIDAGLFDKVSQIASAIRDNSMSFGGIQIIVTGDFLQLPPIQKKGHGPREVPKFAFEGQQWQKVFQHQLVLTTVFRQRSQDFVNLLNDIRQGHVSDATKTVLERLSRPIPPIDGINPTEIYPRTDQVKRANTECLKKLLGPTYDYSAQDTGPPGLLHDSVAPQQLQLRLGAQVMLIKNLEAHLVNGSRGIVVGFSDSSAQPDGPPNPIVRFLRPDGTTHKVSLARQIWTKEDRFGNPIATRTQIPLILAWSISIHKSQGQTINFLKVDLHNVFADGQAYVALSRATSLDRLQVLNFDVKKVTANCRVRDWMQTLTAA